tara:strand:- start:2703 stop:3707 length:1005 start_codon:yes stop_codon:yes gene_type:complete
MKKITKVGLSALAGALAISSANAGEVSISGAMEITYITGSGYQDTGNGFGQDNEFTITASTELDNGTSVAYKRTVNESFAGNDSELSFGTTFGTIAMTSAGSPISAIDDKTPTAFEEANAQVGSIDDVNGMDGTFGVRYTLADVMGSGMSLDAMWSPVHGTGDTHGDQGSSVAHGNGDAVEVTLTGSVPMVEGLSLGIGYANLEEIRDYTGTVGASTDDQDEGTGYITYAYGPFTAGYQVSAVSVGTSNTLYKTEYIGLSYSVSDNLSVSYNTIESDRTAQDGLVTEQEFDSFSVGYSMGGMTLSVVDQDCSKCSYTYGGRNQDETAVSLSVAF